MLTFGTVICTYNRRHLLEQSLSHWCQSNRFPDQFIVIDATEDAGQYRDVVMQKFPRLFSHPNSHYIVTNKPGLTIQRNLGLKFVETDIVCFADDDTFVTEDYVTKILEVFERDTYQSIGGVNGVALGQFDQWQQKYSRLIKNYVRHHYGWWIQRIHVPKHATKLFEPLAPELRGLPLIHIDRLWGANMNYRTELIYDLGFDENFQRYGLFEDVDMSVRVGKTHKLVCRLDAEITHDDSLGKSTRPSDARYFLASWVNSAYIIEKLFPCNESRHSHQRLFDLISFIAKTGPQDLREKKFRTLGNEELLQTAKRYVALLQESSSQGALEETFVKLQEEILALQT